MLTVVLVIKHAHTGTQANVVMRQDASNTNMGIMLLKVAVSKSLGSRNHTALALPLLHFRHIATNGGFNSTRRHTRAAGAGHGEPKWTRANTRSSI